MIYDTLDSKMLFRSLHNGSNFLINGQLYLKVRPEANANAVNLSTNQLTIVGSDVEVNLVQVKIVDVK